MSQLIRPGYLMNRKKAGGSVGPQLATLDPANTSANISLSNGNLTATSTSAATGHSQAIIGKSTGKYYWEIVMSTYGGGLEIPGFIGTTTYDGSNLSGTGSMGVISSNPARLWIVNNSFGAIYSAAIPDGATIKWAIDLDAKKVWVAPTGNPWNADGAANPATGTNGISYGAALTDTVLKPALSFHASGITATVNFGGSAYIDTPPAGFGNWT